MKWVTRARPKIDRIACPWLVTRFIDKDAEFLYVPTDTVLAVAEETGAIPYDIPGVEYGHVGELCSFDAFIRKHHLTDPALQQLAVIVRGADTARPELAPQCPAMPRLASDVAGPVAQLSRRSRDATPRHGDVRRALRVAATRAGRAA